MRTLIVGTGAIGSLVGNKLARAGHKVTLIGRPDYVDVVMEKGVGLEEVGRRTYVKDVRVATHVTQVTDATFDVIIFTMKAYDTAEAAAQVRLLTRRGTPLLVMQNGVGGEEVAAQVLREDSPTIFSAVITLSVEVLELGLVRLSTTRGGIGLAPTAPGLSVDFLTKAFREAGFKTITYPHHRLIKWSKLLLNILGNASAAVLGLSPDQVFADPRLFTLEMTAFREALAVMQAMGVQPVNLPGYPVPLLAWCISTLPDWLLRPIFQRLIVQGRGGKMPSLYLDVMNHRQCSEVEFLNGAVVKQARNLGVAVPANEVLYSTLMRIVRGETPWENYRHQPERFLAIAGLQGG